MQVLKKDREPTSYITDYFKVPESVYWFLKALLQDFNEETQHFYFHVYACCCLPQNLKEGEFIPIPRTTIDEKWKHGFVDIDLLIAVGLLDRTDNYSREKHICYKYRIPFFILEKCGKLHPVTVNQIRDTIYCNLMNGRKINKFKSSVLTYGEHKDKLPDTVYQAIVAFDETFFNHYGSEDYLQKAEAGVVTERHKRKLSNDQRCFESVVNRLNYDTIGYEIASYIPSYEAQMSGRITELEGALQSCSKAMKKAAFTFHNCYNYDLKSSQVYGLKWWFEKAKFSTAIFDWFFSQNKDDWAKQIGISKSCLKNCIYAMFMGAELPSDSSKYWDKKAGKYKEQAFTLSVAKYLLKEAIKINNNPSTDSTEEDKSLATKFLKEFNNLFAPLKKQLKLFYQWLLYDYCEKQQYRGTVKNLTGMLFDLKDYEKNDKGKYKHEAELSRKITAFFLQGTEAALMHYLTKKEIQIKYGYKVINNAHDGLVTIGLIPEAAIEEVKNFYGFPYAFLELKQICSKEEQEWWRNT